MTLIFTDFPTGSIQKWQNHMVTVYFLLGNLWISEALPDSCKKVKCRSDPYLFFCRTFFILMLLRLHVFMLFLTGFCSIVLYGATYLVLNLKYRVVLLNNWYCTVFTTYCLHFKQTDLTQKDMACNERQKLTANAYLVTYRGLLAFKRD